jgi:dTDP-4-dehydrorhamnose 3,5-epimerase
VPVEVTPFAVEPTEIPGLVAVRVKQITDERGTIREFFRQSAMQEAGLHAGPWLQLNVTETKPGAIRGLHGEPTTKLVSVVSGTAFGAYLDARPDSPTRGKVVTIELTLGTQVLVPPGVCNGFQVTSDVPSQYLYCFDREWSPTLGGFGVHPLDPALGIAWPIDVDATDGSLLSAKDAAQPPFAEI